MKNFKRLILLSVIALVSLYAIGRLAKGKKN